MFEAALLPLQLCQLQHLPCPARENRLLERCCCWCWVLRKWYMFPCSTVQVRSKRTASPPCRCCNTKSRTFDVFGSVCEMKLLKVLVENCPRTDAVVRSTRPNSNLASLLATALSIMPRFACRTSAAWGCFGDGGFSSVDLPASGAVLGTAMLVTVSQNTTKRTL